MNVGEIWKTRKNTEVMILSIDPAYGDVAILGRALSSGAPMSYDMTGAFYSGDTSPNDLVEKVTPKTYRYINIYVREIDGTFYPSYEAYISREKADTEQYSNSRVGCIKVELAARFDD